MRSNSLSSVSSSSSSSSTSTMDREDSVQIFVKHPTGTTFSMTIPPDTSIDSLKSAIAQKKSLSNADMRLLHAGKHLTGGDSLLSDHRITRNSTLDISWSMRGGMPPKKIRCGFKDCKDAAQRIVGDCGFCSGQFCGRHRLLEDHKCAGLEDCKKESHERNASKLNSERTVAIRGI